MTTASTTTERLLRQLVLRMDKLLSRHQADQPLNFLAPHFTFQYDLLSNISAGTNSVTIRPSPNRWGLFISVPIGTRALVTRIAGSPVDNAGVFIVPQDGANNSYGILTDDTLDDVSITIPTHGFLVSQGFDIVTHFAGYYVAVYQVFYQART